MLRNFILLAIILFYSMPAHSQTANIRGLLTDEFNIPLPEITVKLAGTTYEAKTESTGGFHFDNVPFGDYVLEVHEDEYVSLRKEIKAEQQMVDLGKLIMLADQQKASMDQLPTITLDESENATQNESVSSALGASRDAFESATAFTFSAARFRVRGYMNEYFTTLVNGIRMHDLASGRTLYSSWGGLNDVVRSRESIHGLGPSMETFGAIGGVTSIDSRASRQRRQMQISYAASNRTYENRLMATFGTGMLKGGWSAALSFSRRWADEGYVQGTFYDGFSYFMSIEKQHRQHSVSLTHFGAKSKYARTSPGTQEVFDLTNNHYYNSYWGYQNGEKRSSAVNDNFLPLTLLNHEWKVNDDVMVETAVSYQFGEEKKSALEWFNAPDPRPDYYRNLPGFITISDSTPQAAINAAFAAEQFANNTNVSQIDWEKLYEANYIAADTALYIIEDRISNHKRYNFASTVNQVLSDRIVMSIGTSYQRQVTDYYKEVKDLLGGQYYINWNQYAEFDFPGNATALQNDLNNPNRLVRKGDRFGYDYTADIAKYGVWMQWQLKYDYFDYFAALFFDETRFSRTGNVKNGIFEDFSYGKDAVKVFTNQGVKGGITYKYNSRNYIYLNGAWLTKAPLFENAYVSPRTRNLVVPGLENEVITSVEGGYILRAPKIKGRISAYYTQVNDQTETNSFYHDDFRTFVNYTTINLDVMHTGLEAAATFEAGNGFSVSPVIAITKNTFTSRPLAYITQDNKDTLLASGETIYIKNYHLGSGAQSAYTLGLSYRGKEFWNLYLNLSYYDNIWISVNPARRTTDAVDLKNPGSDEWRNILDQEKAKGQFIMDVSGSKSWRLNNKFKSLKPNAYIILNAGVTNLLNNKDLITGGFEQLRFDYREKNPNKFAPKYYYGFGASYFASVTLRFN